MRLLLASLALTIAVWPSPAPAQDRDAKVRNDRQTFLGVESWVYNDLDEGLRVAIATDRPVMVVFRCIPCEACQKFDDDVARRDQIIRDLLDRFVCVRIVQANALDLNHFQYDFDQSFAITLMNPDMTIYGRFGTRSDRPESEDISLLGLRAALEAALRMHREFTKVKPSLAGKQVTPTRYKTPRDYPSLSGKFEASLNYEGQVARSCMHCHQLREAERLVHRAAAEPIPDNVLFPYPDPAVLGLTMDPNACARVLRVRPGSPAAQAGIAAGDEIATFAGQPLISVADLQWVLHNTPSTARLVATVRRDGKTRETTLVFDNGWRHGDISWRVSTWDLRRMGLGGLRLDDLTADERGTLRIAPHALALRVRHVGEFGAHAVAKKAGFRKGDVIVAYDGMTNHLSESDVLAHAVQKRRPGDDVPVTVVRDGARVNLKLPMQ
jgi:hypothetical protein